MRLTDHDQIGMDLAEHASQKASAVMLNALSLCDTRAQATMVAFKVLAVLSAQAAGVFAKQVDVKLEDMSAADILQMMAGIMREMEGGGS